MVSSAFTNIKNSQLVVVMLLLLLVSVKSDACQTSDTQTNVMVKVWKHPDGAATGLMPIFSLYDSSNIRYQITTQLDRDYMFIQKIATDGSVTWSMKYDVMTTTNEAVLSSDGSKIRMLVATMANADPVLLEINTSDGSVNMAYVQADLLIDTGAMRHNHLVCSPATETTCFINIFETELTKELICKVDFSGLTNWSCEDVSGGSEVAVSGLGATSDNEVVVFAFDQASAPSVDYQVYLLDFTGPSVTWSMSDTSAETMYSSDAILDMYTKADVHITSDQAKAIITFDGEAGTYVLDIAVSDGSTNGQYKITVSDADSYKQYTSTLMSDTMLTIFAMNGATDKVGYTHMVDMSDWSVTSYKSGTNVPPVYVSMESGSGYLNYLGCGLDEDELISISVMSGKTKYANEFFMMADTVTIAAIAAGDLTLATYAQTIATDDQTATSTAVTTTSYSLETNDENSYTVKANIWYDEYKDMIVGETGNSAQFGPIEFTCFDTVSSGTTLNVAYSLENSDGDSIDSWLSFSSSSGKISYDGTQGYHGTIKLKSTYTYPYTSFTQEKELYSYMFYNGATSSRGGDDDDDYCLDTTSSTACGFFVFLIIAFFILIIAIICILLWIFFKGKSAGTSQVSSKNQKVQNADVNVDAEAGGVPEVPNEMGRFNQTQDNIVDKSNMEKGNETGAKELKK